MPRKAKPEKTIEYYYLDQARNLPNHDLEKTSDGFICKRCGFVLGSGGGRIPKCYEASQEQVSNNITNGLAILNKLKYPENE